MYFEKNTEKHQVNMKITNNSITKNYSEHVDIFTFSLFLCLDAYLLLQKLVILLYNFFHLKTYGVVLCYLIFLWPFMLNACVECHCKGVSVFNQSSV